MQQPASQADRASVARRDPRRVCVPLAQRARASRASAVSARRPHAAGSRPRHALRPRLPLEDADRVADAQRAARGEVHRVLAEEDLTTTKTMTRGPPAADGENGKHPQPTVKGARGRRRPVPRARTTATVLRARGRRQPVPRERTTATVTRAWGGRRRRFRAREDNGDGSPRARTTATRAGRRRCDLDEDGQTVSDRTRRAGAARGEEEPRVEDDDDGGRANDEDGDGERDRRPQTHARSQPRAARRR